MRILRRWWWRILFGQKDEWDRVAFSFLNKANSILDIGCGRGRFITQDPSKIKGIDWNPVTVEECQKLSYNVIAGDIRHLPFDDNSFSGIHCSHVIEHFLPVDVYQILSECNRVLEPEGIIVVRSPLLWDGFYSDLTHIRPYNPEAIMHYLFPSNQRTFKQISNSYEMLHLRWRYKPIRFKNVYLDEFFRGLNKWGFPWFRKNGYMFVIKKKLQ